MAGSIELGQSLGQGREHGVGAGQVPEIAVKAGGGGGIRATVGCPGAMGLDGDSEDEHRHGTGDQAVQEVLGQGGVRDVGVARRAGKGVEAVERLETEIGHDALAVEECGRKGMQTDGRIALGAEFPGQGPARRPTGRIIGIKAVGPE